MRRAGQNPTDVEIVSIINKYDNDSGFIDFKVSVLKLTRSNYNLKEFCFIMQDVSKESRHQSKNNFEFQIFLTFSANLYSTLTLTLQEDDEENGYKETFRFKNLCSYSDDMVDFFPKRKYVRCSLGGILVCIILFGR